ncbi:MAG: hypothetical protein HKP12_00725 [Gammaproteobacteria bacterium]|nr:hypothetical protein [Gammaproteobacteria bacterium]NNJ95667.1 hypothetical protein [Gammaproteobacteria bacterium]
MSEPVYNIAFYGIIQPEKDKEMVIENLASLFKTTPENVRPFFAGGRKIIKSGVDELTAEKYRVALENVGLVIKIEALEAEPDAKASNTATAQNDDSRSTEAPGAASQDDSAVVEAQQNIDAGNFTLAEVGADVLENPPDVEPQPIGDISSITLAEVGADLLLNPTAIKPQPIADISHITLAEVSDNVIEKPKRE